MAFLVICRNYLNILIGRQLLHFFNNPFALSALVFPNNLALYLKDLKALPLAIYELKSVVSSFDENHNHKG